jgi:UDP-3-O-[3-hydroxymyristoyl] glucosamine N-acyltransferase
VIVPEDLADAFEGPRLVSSNPYLIFQRAVQLFYGPGVPTGTGVHRTAVIGEGVETGTEVFIGPYAIVEDGCRIEDRVFIGAGSFVGKNGQIGEATVIYPRVSIYPDTTIGCRVIIHSGATIGSDGFGFAFDGTQYKKIPQIGRVVIEDDVEIGANTAIDRAALGVTRIEQGVKIDNLVQVAHSVTIGAHTVIAGQTGISGSTRIGKYVQVGGQVGFVGHIEIGDRARIGAQSGISRSVPEGETMFGYPARPHAEMMKIEATHGRLPELLKTVREQQKRIQALEERLKALEQRDG